MPGLPLGRSAHRTKHPRQCDRCRRPAVWNVRPRSGPVRYYCDEHVEDSPSPTNSE